MASRKLAAGLIFAPATAFTFSLGIWQVNRLQEKQQMIDYRKSRLTSDPRSITSGPLPWQSEESLADWEYVPVTLKGKFLTDPSFLVGPKVNVKRKGNWLVSPFVLADGTPVLVHRGWIPETQDVDSLPSPTSVTGVVRRHGQRSSFMPESNAAQGNWFFLDLTGMTEVLRSQKKNLKVDAGTGVAYVQVTGESGYGEVPVTDAKEELLSFRVDPLQHTVYAATWFSLSTLLAIMTRKFMKAPKRP